MHAVSQSVDGDEGSIVHQIWTAQLVKKFQDDIGQTTFEVSKDQREAEALCADKNNDLFAGVLRCRS